MSAYLGVDIGGTKTAVGLVGADGTVLARHVAETPAKEGPAAIVDAVVAVAAGMPAVACGVGTAGTVDDHGRITASTDSLAAWEGTDLRSVLATRLGLPVVVVNDVHAMAVGETVHGAAAGARDAFVVAIGTGIGGALVCDGVVRHGRTGMAGSIGHVPALVPPDLPAEPVPRCPCGALGHLEAYASGPAIAGGAPLERLAERGDAATLRAIHRAGLILGHTLGAYVTLLDPDVLVLGGGVTGLGALLLEPAERALRAQARPGPAAVPLRTAALGTDGVLVGAATLAQRMAQKEVTR